MSTVKNLRLRYTLGLSVIALLVTASFITMKRVVHQQRNYSSLVNIAGHQAGFSNRIAYFISLMAITEDETEYSMARSQVGRTINKMKAAHKALRNGNPEKNIPYVINDNLETIYEDPMVGLDLALDRFLKRAEQIYESDMESVDTGSANYIYVTTYGPHILEPMLDAAVEEYEIIARCAVYEIERLELIIWLATLLTLLMEAGLIFRPMEFQVRKTIKSLERSIAELTLTRGRLQAAQEMAMIGDWQLDLRSGSLTWSDQLYAICGIAPETFSVTLDSALRLIHPDDRERIRSKLQAIGQHRQPSDMEYRIIRPDGGVRTVHQHAVAVNGGNGGAEIISGVVQDITERKKAEADKEQLKNKLTQANKMEAIGTLAGGVAHDLNNVLSGIVSYPDLLLLQLSEDSPLVKPITTIRESGLKASAIVQDLLTLARRGVAVKKSVDLNAIVSGYLQSPEYAKLKSYHPRVMVSVDLDCHLFRLNGSPVHLLNTVMNLVSNAAEAMPDGGTISLSTANRYIDHPIRGHSDIVEGEYVVLTVSDTGVGISPEDQERIFEPFYTKKSMGRSGTGLGMAVVWGTVKDHNGYIDLASAVNEGSAFHLYFPAARGFSEVETKTKTAADYKGNGEFILVVDDLASQRDIAIEILSALGYVVTAVASGSEAVKWVQQKAADLLVLDMIMEPGMDGLETYRKILDIRPSQKAIIASGFSETDRVKEAQRLGAGPYLKKPYTIENLGATVKTELLRQ